MRINAVFTVFLKSAPRFNHGIAAGTIVIIKRAEAKKAVKFRTAFMAGIILTVMI